MKQYRRNLLNIVTMIWLLTSCASSDPMLGQQTALETSTSSGKTERVDTLDAERNGETLSVWREAAEVGDPWAMLQLGRLYLEGRSVPQDYVLAHMWFNLAASRDEEGAAEERDSLNKHMTQTERADAQKRAREWRPRASAEAIQSAPAAGRSNGRGPTITNRRRLGYNMMMTYHSDGSLLKANCEAVVWAVGRSTESGQRYSACCPEQVLNELRRDIGNRVGSGGMRIEDYKVSAKYEAGEIHLATCDFHSKSHGHIYEFCEDRVLNALTSYLRELEGESELSSLLSAECDG